MNRAETQHSLQRFVDRLACATVADTQLAKAYIDALASYLATLADDWQPIDIWSIEEYERACGFVRNNERWILNSSIALDAFADANSLLAAHKTFLAENGLLQKALEDRPASFYVRMPTGEVRFVNAL